MKNYPTLFSIIEVLLVVVPVILTVAYITVAERKTMASVLRRLGYNATGYLAVLSANSKYAFLAALKSTAKLINYVLALSTAFCLPKSHTFVTSPLNCEVHWILHFVSSELARSVSNYIQCCVAADSAAEAIKSIPQVSLIFIKGSYYVFIEGNIQNIDLHQLENLQKSLHLACHSMEQHKHVVEAWISHCDNTGRQICLHGGFSPQDSLVNSSIGAYKQYFHYAFTGTKYNWPSQVSLSDILN